MKAFMGNDYPRSFICSASAARPPREHDGERAEEERPPTVHLPYVAGVVSGSGGCVRCGGPEGHSNSGSGSSRLR